MKKHRIAFAVVLAAMAALASASSWEGSAMMGSYGDFPASGYYAACNSFARNTSVEVLNLENGRSITVIVTRGLENSGVFMMFSVEAAGALGLQPGRVARIRASEPRSAVELAPARGSSSSFDPDLNPRLMAAEELKRLGYELTETGSKAVETPAAPVSAPSSPAVAAVEPALGPKPVPASAATPVPATAVKPTAIGVEAPASATARGAAVPVAEPSPVTGQRPEPLAATKPRPVRTVVLPQLPEPSTPVAKVPAPKVPERAPEAFASVLPVPDETPIRVSPTVAPRRYEAPALRPEAFAAGPRAVAAGVAGPVAMAEPLPVSHERAMAYVMTAPSQLAATAAAELADPSLHLSQKAEALARMVPRMEASGTTAELAWPEIEADEIPDVALALLVAPASTIPATSLAEGEMILPSTDGPAALAIETPVYGAAETMVALEEAQVVPAETPVAVAKGSPATSDSTVPAGLAEAAEQKPETTPYVESPREYIVAIEPTSPKPPSATSPAAASPSAAPAPVPASSKPAAGIAPAATASASPAAPVGALQKGRYYIQIGAYRNESAAKDASSKIGASFAVLIERIGDKGKETWRVYVGPLSRDESGVALVKVRSMGYKDAFVKSGS